MANGSVISIDFVIVATLVGLVTEEVDGLETLICDVLKAVSLVPASWEHVEGDLAANRVGQRVIWELLLEGTDHLSTDAVLLVISLKLVSLFGGRVSTDWRNVDHAVTELNESTSSLWKLDLRKILQNEDNELVVLLLAQPIDEGLGGKLFTASVGSETIFSEAVIKHLENIGTKLFTLLCQIRATNKPNHSLLSDLSQSVLHFVGNRKSGGSQGSVNIKQTDGVLLWSLSNGYSVHGKLIFNVYAECYDARTAPFYTQNSSYVLFHFGPLMPLNPNLGSYQPMHAVLISFHSDEVYGALGPAPHSLSQLCRGLGRNSRRNPGLFGLIRQCAEQVQCLEISGSNDSSWVRFAEFRMKQVLIPELRSRQKFVSIIMF